MAAQQCCLRGHTSTVIASHNVWYEPPKVANILNTPIRCREQGCRRQSPCGKAGGVDDNKDTGHTTCPMPTAVTWLPTQ